MCKTSYLQAVAQLTPAMLERHLEGITEKLRGGVNGEVREVIQQSVARILVGVDGTVTLEIEPDALLGVKAIQVRLDGKEEDYFSSASIRQATGDGG